MYPLLWCQRYRIRIRYLRVFAYKEDGSFFSYACGDEVMASNTRRSSLSKMILEYELHFAAVKIQHSYRNQRNFESVESETSVTTNAADVGVHKAGRTWKKLQIQLDKVLFSSTGRTNRPPEQSLEPETQLHTRL